MTMETKEVLFELEQETKGALRYQEVDGKGKRLKTGEGATVGTLYLRKSEVEGKPEKVKVTLSFE